MERPGDPYIHQESSVGIDEYSNQISRLSGQHRLRYVTVGQSDGLTVLHGKVETADTS